MRVLTSLKRRGRAGKPLVLAIGVFDGVHRGHQAVLKAAVELARTWGCLAGALTFDPPPEGALGLPMPPRLGHPDELSEVMAGLGLDEVHRVPFTRALGRLSPERFAAGVLAAKLRCKAVVVGRGFRFGADAAGGVSELRRLGARLGFAVVDVAPCMRRGKAVSSTLLRRAVQSGRMGEAKALLGRPWRLRGTVVRGRRLGRTLGFPTANLDSPQRALPPRGVWAGRCRLVTASGPSRWWGFAGNLGVRPTLGSRLEPTVELHLLGFKGRLEGRVLEAEFLRRLRGERKFPTLRALQARISADVAAAQALLKSRRGADF
jgi:riboflavin kinase/FMN adenylyltransferase